MEFGDELLWSSPIDANIELVQKVLEILHDLICMFCLVTIQLYAHMEARAFFPPIQMLVVISKNAWIYSIHSCV